MRIHSGPAAANTVTPGAFITAEAALQGHAATLFLACDGVACLPPGVRAGLEGQGTGRLADRLAVQTVAGIAAPRSGPLAWAPCGCQSVAMRQGGGPKWDWPSA